MIRFNNYVPIKAQDPSAQDRVLVKTVVHHWHEGQRRPRGSLYLVSKDYPRP